MSTTVSSSTALQAINVWKMFGPGSDTYLRDSGNCRKSETLAQRGLVTGVRDASFEVQHGEIFMLMGLSGSGKSTLLRCLTGLNALSSGEVMINSQSLANASRRKLMEIRRREISMVFQNFALLPHLTALDNVAFPLRMNGVSRDKRHTEAKRLLELVGLANKQSFYPHELSGGQQQRVGIARSLITDPVIWFLDEPFSALDPLIRKEMQNEFLRLQSTLQKTIVFVTHDFDEAVRLGDRIAIMRDGCILQIGTAEDLVLHPVNDYVRAFVKDIPHEKVVSVRAIVDPLESIADRDAPLSADQKIGEVAQRLITADRPIAVVDGSGALIGQASRHSFAAWLK